MGGVEKVLLGGNSFKDGNGEVLFDFDVEGILFFIKRFFFLWFFIIVFFGFFLVIKGCVCLVKLLGIIGFR